MYQNILFDLDGTLTDPGIGITNSVIYAMRQFKLAIPEREKLYPFIGPPLYESFERFCGLSHGAALQAVAYYRTYYREQGIFENQVIPGIPELLADLTQNGQTCILATSKPTEFAVRILEHFDLAKYFSGISGASMDSSHVEKPLIVADALKFCKSGLSVMVGDREHDVFGAKANQIPCIGVLFGYGSREELTAAGADEIAETPEDLRKILIFN